VNDRLTVDVRVLFSSEERDAAFREEALLGLTSMPKELQPKWLYDERGSELFDEITRLSEYYLTRAEQLILDERAPEIAKLSNADTVIELGSGTSEKTRTLLDELQPIRFVPFDVSEEFLRGSAAQLNADYPDLIVEAIVGDFERHLGELPADDRRLLVFLGSTIGNFPTANRRMFFRDVAEVLEERDTFLLGVDLVKDVGRLEGAYDDAAGVTAAFNLNVLSVLNNELGADFDLGGFQHVARWDRKNEWMEMSVRSLRRQSVSIPELDLVVQFNEGELMQTEISTKFRREYLESDLRVAGLDVERWWTDPAGDFALLLARPSGSR
jgi:L-histidine N-alpha-methyltransferase